MTKALRYAVSALLVVASGVVGGACSGGEEPCEGDECAVDEGPTREVEQEVGIGGRCGGFYGSCDLGLACCSQSIGYSYCRNTFTDEDHCGGCGVQCVNNATCNTGVCQCDAGFTLCSGQCRHLATDEANCGSCGNTCSGGQLCANGGCGEPCDYHGECPSGKICIGTLLGFGDAIYMPGAGGDPPTSGSCQYKSCTTNGNCSGYEAPGDSEGGIVFPAGENKLICCGLTGSKTCIASASDPAHCGACNNNVCSASNITCYSGMAGGTEFTTACLEDQSAPMHCEPAVIAATYYYSRSCP